MVANITSLTGNGLRDWLIQRVTAVILGLYFLLLLGFAYLHPDLQYQYWSALFQLSWFRIASLLTLIALMLHAWIGIWTVTTDYLHGAGVRICVQLVVIIVLLASLIWGVEILWGLN